MAKKRYPIISVFVAVVWAVFFYPADPAPKAQARTVAPVPPAAPADPAATPVSDPYNPGRYASNDAPRRQVNTGMAHGAVEAPQQQK